MADRNGDDIALATGVRAGLTRTPAGHRCRDLLLRAIDWDHRLPVVNSGDQALQLLTGAT